MAPRTTHPSYEQRGSAEARSRLQELADVLGIARVVFHQQGELFEWKPVAGSVGRDEAQAAQRGSRLAGMAAHAPAVASAMVRTATEQLAGLATIVRAGEVFGAVEVVVRAAMENCAYACWVMDPGVTGIQRGARVLAAELTTVAHLREAVEEVAGSGDLEFQVLSGRFDQLTNLANDLYGPVEMPRGRDRRFTVGGEKYPTFTQAIVAWAEGPGGGRVSGRGLYGLLCSDTHPKALAARVNWRPGSRETAAEQIVEVGYLERVCTAALSPFYGALVCLASYHGWLGNRPLAQFEAAYERIALDVFGQPRGVP